MKIEVDFYQNGEKTEMYLCLTLTVEKDGDKDRLLDLNEAMRKIDPTFRGMSNDWNVLTIPVFLNTREYFGGMGHKPLEEEPSNGLT